MSDPKTEVVDITKGTLGDRSVRAPDWWRPTSPELAMQFANKLAVSGLVPKDYDSKPERVFTAMVFGAELGLSPLSALQNIAVINGRPTLWGDAVMALCQAHPECEWIKEWKEGDGEQTTAYCEVKRRGYPAHVQHFSVGMAKNAKLWGKNVWAAYPSRMLQMRARSLALRDRFADALSGIAFAEEERDKEVVKQADARVVAPQTGLKGLGDKIRARAAKPEPGKDPLGDQIQAGLEEQDGGPKPPPQIEYADIPSDESTAPDDTAARSRVFSWLMSGQREANTCRDWFKAVKKRNPKNCAEAIGKLPAADCEKLIKWLNDTYGFGAEQGQQELLP